MNKQYFYGFTAIALVAAFVLPNVSFALNQGAAIIQSQITQSTLQVEELKNQLKKLDPAAYQDSLKKREYCYEFGRNLQRGDRGDDVVYLNKILKVSGFDADEKSPEFTTRTETALRAYQAKNPEILKRAGITQATGVFGPSTKNYVAGTFGCGDVYGKPQDHSNSVLNRPTDFVDFSYNADVNRDGLVNVTDLLAVIQAWGKCPVVATADNVKVANPCPADINGDSVVDEHDLQLVIKYWNSKPTTTEPVIRVTTPNGGESWFQGQTYRVGWKSENVGKLVTIVFRHFPDGNTQSSTFTDYGISDIANDGVEEVKIDSYPTGVYTVQVKSNVNGTIVSDWTDSFFKIYPKQASINADITGDGKVNVDDLLAVINAWGKCVAIIAPTANSVSGSGATCTADINKDGIVNDLDLQLVIRNWSKPAPTTTY